MWLDPGRQRLSGAGHTHPNAGVVVDGRPTDRTEEAETILGAYSSGVVPLSQLDVRRLECLVAVGLAELDARQNDGPTVSDVLEFMHRWEYVTAHGYVFSRRREERHVTIDGIECDVRRVPIEEVARLRAEFHAFGANAVQYDDANLRLYASWG